MVQRSGGQGQHLTDAQRHDGGQGQRHAAEGSLQLGRRALDPFGQRDGEGGGVAVLLRFGRGIAGQDAAPLGRQRQQDLPHPRAMGQRHLGLEDAIAEILKQQAKRAGIVEETGIAEAAGPDQVGLLRQRLFQPDECCVDQARDHGGIGAGGFAGARGVRLHPPQRLLFDQALKDRRRQDQKAHPLPRPLQHREQRPVGGHLQKLGQRGA